MGWDLGWERPTPGFAEGLPRSQAAIMYAERMHAGQRRGDGMPFILHPLEVASLLHSVGSPDHLIAAGVMHDLVEKAGVSATELERRFGRQISGLVLAVSDDEQVSGYAARKRALRSRVAAAGNEVLVLFAADKLSKLRELRRETERDGAGSDTPECVRAHRARRLEHYQRSVALLDERVPESMVVVDLRNELGAFLRRRQPVTQ